MGGRFALRSEIIGRAHQSFAKAHLPQAVHHHASGQRIAGRHQPLSEAQAVAWCIRRHGGEDRGHPWLHKVERMIILAALQHMGGARLWQILHDQRGGNARAHGFLIVPGLAQRLIRRTLGGGGVMLHIVVQEQRLLLSPTLGSIHVQNAAHLFAVEPSGGFPGRGDTWQHPAFIEGAVETQPGIATPDAQELRVLHGTGEGVAIDIHRHGLAIDKDLQTGGFPIAIIT